MRQATSPTAINSKERLVRGAIIATLVFASQSIGTAPRADASTMANVYEGVSVAIAYDLGSKACGMACGAAAAAATIVVNEKASDVANTGATVTKSRLQSIFGFWGFH